MKSIQELNVKLFADGADILEMKKVYQSGCVKGFTTNPTLMRKGGVVNFKDFAISVLKEIQDLPVSFEVLSDEFDAMNLEAREIASWGANVNVKIPVTNTKGASSVPLIKELSAEGLALNVTGILTNEQVQDVCNALSPKVKSIVSVFAGRIADTGRDPVPYMTEAANILKSNPNAELLWASSRELLNIFQAEASGCHIITVTPDILRKTLMVGKDLKQLSLETVQMLHGDAKAAGYTIIN